MIAGPDRDEIRRMFEHYDETRAICERNALVSAHLAMAERLARRMARRGEPVEDLVQVASLALVHAVERFDCRRGLVFCTFATPTIVGELKRHFRDKGWVVRVPRRIQEMHLRLGVVIGDLTQQMGRPPTVAEMAEAISATEAEVRMAIGASHAYRPASLDAPGESTDGGYAFEVGGDDPRLAVSDDRACLIGLLAQLAERERSILRLRYFHDQTQSQIATALGLSQMHVSRLLSRSLLALRSSGAENPSGKKAYADAGNAA